MHSIGFSTGALAKNDVKRGIELQRALNVGAIEISALRYAELGPVIRALEMLTDDIRDIPFKSFHAPSEIPKNEEQECVEKIAESIPEDWLIVVHPDAIHDFRVWEKLGGRLCIENMDQRKPHGRTYGELEQIFKELPSARFCFDIGHCHQMDPTMTEAVGLLSKLRKRLALVHVSEVNHRSRHVPISYASFGPFSDVKEFLPEDCPMIIESVVEGEEIRKEFEKVRRCFNASTEVASSR